MAKKPGNRATPCAAKPKPTIWPGLDYAGLLGSAETLHTDVTTLPARTQELESLTGQLYTSWDKILVDLRDRKSGGMRDYEEELRTVKTKFPDAAGKDGVTTSDDSWARFHAPRTRFAENNIGMSVAHKPVGKYDTEADEVAEPAGFAYMAPVGRAQPVWLLGPQQRRQLLGILRAIRADARSVVGTQLPADSQSYEWESYRTARSSGQTYYGRDEAAQRAQIRHARHLHATALRREPLCAQRRRIQQLEICQRQLAQGRKRRRTYLWFGFEAAQFRRLQAAQHTQLSPQLPATFRRPVLRPAALADCGTAS